MAQKTTKADFLERAKLIHGDRYDYSKVDYKTTEIKVIIICELHGEFLLRPRAHYADHRGCPDCDKSGKSGFHKSNWTKESKYIYLIELFGNGEKFLNYGITVNEIKDRLSKGQTPYSHKILIEKKIQEGETAIKIKQEIEIKYQKFKYFPNLQFKGHTDCLEYSLKKSIVDYLSHKVIEK